MREGIIGVGGMFFRWSIVVNMGEGSRCVKIGFLSDIFVLVYFEF